MDINSEDFKLHIVDIKRTRMKELFAVVKSSSKSTLLEKFGIVTIYTQMLEESIKDLIILSNKINNISININFDKLTFGNIINI